MPKFLVWDDRDEPFIKGGLADDSQNWREASQNENAALQYANDWGDRNAEGGVYYVWVLPEEGARRIFADFHEYDMEFEAKKIATRFECLTEWHAYEVGNE